MALLELQNIGKIYVSDGNVTVGIRGVDLSFDRGEFVAVTGKSGSGKSTLLNVISGMDSYEEGQLLIEGQPTSHYLQPEWEEYRREYISFIFQDYNIIESYTVLQNVELALMHINDRRERRARALELIERVGLSDRIRQKGSRLSGGQKQRTVIARALAKDSPIILADEPTGNLDSASAAEIIELLREVSRDRLLIVITHSFDEVASCATRHIRIHDGKVAADHRISEPEPEPAPDAETDTVEADLPAHRESVRERCSRVGRDLRNGVALGWSIFTARPKLSAFICLLLVAGTLGMFFVTSVCGEAVGLFDEDYMFRHIDGRVVVVSETGRVIDAAELDRIAEKYGAESVLRHDMMLDLGNYLPLTWQSVISDYLALNCVYGEDYGDNIVGRYPSAPNEVLLRLPIGYRDSIGDSIPENNTVTLYRLQLNVVGISYYYDNTLEPECLFTEEGFVSASSIFTMLYKMQNGSIGLTSSFCCVMPEVSGTIISSDLPHALNITVSHDVEPGKMYVNDYNFNTEYEMLESRGIDFWIEFDFQYWTHDVTYETSALADGFTYRLGGECLIPPPEDGLTGSPIITPTDTEIELYGYVSFIPPDGGYSARGVVMSASLASEIAQELLDRSYRQASLFFEDDARAHEVADALRSEGYVAITSDSEYIPDPFETILSTVSLFLYAAVWVLTLLFLAFFVNLCSMRAIGAFKGDMAIMRSMGIPVRVIRIGMYVRMFFSLIPAYLAVLAAAFAIYLIPATNAIYTYLHAWQYALIFFGMLVLICRVTRRQVRRLFGESVKRAIKGGRSE